MTTLFSSISSLKKVGEARVKAYAKLGIGSPYDLLFHYPRSYTDFTSPVNISDAVVDEVNVFHVKITAKLKPQFIKRNMTIFKAIATDGTGDISIIMFNNPYFFESLIKGNSYYMAGKVTVHRTELQINAPKIIHENSEDKILPQYPLCSGLTIRQVRENMHEALKLMQGTEFEWMPSYILKKYNLIPLAKAIETIHFPKNMEDVEIARKRLAFDEMFQLQLGMMMLKKRRKTHTAFHVDNSLYNIDDFINNLPFTLTDGQITAINEIKSDMEKDIPMNRLLQGDVGSGKTVVSAAACYIAFKNNMQSALMAPTEILAQQHYNTLKNFLDKYGVNIVLLTSSLSSAEKKNALKSASDGTADIIIGTNAIMQKKVEYKNLGLVITDEQHRFGVEQRNALSEKGEFPHKLVMSATPIPRTLALMMYGELELSVIRELPKGRQPIETFAVTGKLRQRAYKFIEKEIKAGHQAYIICPLVEESEKLDDMKSVVEYTKAIRYVFPECKIDMLHGRMSSDEKYDVMMRFKSGETDILVSTTVVEVGVDVPNATVMMIEDAQRFGMSQLHQLRGRVGRGNSKSYCILIADKINEESKQRLKTLSSTTDGFKIAEEDLKQRGAGDFFGNRQHGLPPLKIADLASDINLFQQTKNEAEELLSRDHELMQPENRGLRLEVMRLYAKSGDSLN